MSDLNIEALHQFTQQAMAAGAASFIEKASAGEIDPSDPLTAAFADFAPEFCTLRADLVDALTETGDQS